MVLQWKSWSDHGQTHTQTESISTYRLGDRGDRGELGDRGDQGDQSDGGDGGDRGDWGDRGDLGDRGDQSDRGDLGDQGDRDDLGDRGDRGDLGDRGDQGDQGVFAYLPVRHSGTLFLRSLYNYLFKNIGHVRSLCNFDRSCICVFVYLYLCIFTSDTWEHCF